MLRKPKPRYNGTQYAYERVGRAEFQLKELFAFMKKAKEYGRYIYLASLVFEGAFGTVPHGKILDTPRTSTHPRRQQG